MRRFSIPPRPDWRAEARRLGCAFLAEGSESYWNEGYAYAFSLQQIEEEIEAPTQRLLALCYEAVDRVVGDPQLLRKLAIPEPVWDYLKRSWQRLDKDLYGRFDLNYGGSGPAKLFEFNADTPTSLVEASVFQWHWLEQAIARRFLPDDTDQFNSIHEHLVAAFRGFGLAGAMLHLTSVRDHAEDRATIEYIGICAEEAGVATRLIDIEDIGVTADGTFTDLDNRAIAHLFKLYPWEWMVTEEFGRYLPQDRTRFIEPVWKMVLSNKGLLPILWEMHPGDPNLLPSYFADDPRAETLSNAVRKPLHGREGANIEIVGMAGGTRRRIAERDGPFGAEGYILQQYCELPVFARQRPVIGSWVVAGEACGIGIREEPELITGNAARFVPHIIEA